MRYLTSEEKEKIKGKMNREGSNHKDCNFFKIINEWNDGVEVEVGYWITYLNCKPKYEKRIIFLKNNNK